MSNDLPTTGVLPGNKEVVRNVGVARVTGAQLTAAAYKINWLYLIIDIGCVATYENQGRDVWLGMNGVPVAGNTAVLAALPPPVEGQRFYNIQTQQPLQYKGGAWGGASWAANQLLDPTTLVVTASGTLTPGRDYLVLSTNSTHNLPSNTVAKNGHVVRLYVPVGRTNNTAVAGSGTTITTLDSAGNANLLMFQSQVYEYIYADNVWYSFTESATLYLRSENNLSDLSNPEEARDNLGVLSAEQVQALAQAIEAQPNGGLQSFGIVGSADTPRYFAVAFASPEEVLAGVVASKSVSPATLAATVDAKVDAALRFSKYNTVTGFVAGSELFTLTQSASNQITWGTAEYAINLDPDLLTQPIQFGSLAGGDALVPVVAGYSVQYINCTPAGAVTFTDSADVVPALLRLGVALTFNGTILALLQAPQIATSDYYLRGLRPQITGGKIAPVAGLGGTLQATEAELHWESANWAVKTPDLHRQTQASQSPVSWTYFRNEVLEISSANTVVDGRLYGDGSSVPAAAFSIQNVIRDMWGRHYLIAGYKQFASMELAVAGLGAATPKLPAFLANVSTEVARIILRGDQFSGSPALNLNDLAKCLVVDAAVLGGGAGGTAGSDDIRTVTAAGELQYGNTYVIKHSTVSTLPAVGAEGAWIKVKSYKGFKPLIRRKTAGEVLVDDMTGKEDIELELDSYQDFTTLYIQDGKWRY